MFNIIAIKAFETTYLTSNIDRAIKDKRPTDSELINIEKVQLASASLHWSNMFLNLLRYVLGIMSSTFYLYCLGSIDIIKLTTKTNIVLINPDPKLPAKFIKFIKLS